MRNLLLVVWVFLCSITPASAQLSVGIALPGVSIGVSLPVYPQLVPVPGYPVYYAPQLNSNYFFYDGMYWVYQRDNWYASSWYNGPWGTGGAGGGAAVRPARSRALLPTASRVLSRLAIGCAAALGRALGQYVGAASAGTGTTGIAVRRSRPAPLPAYQRQYSGNRYPRAEQQQVLQGQHYRYQPQDAVVQQHYQEQRVRGAAAAPQGKPQARQDRGYPQQAQQKPQKQQQQQQQQQHQSQQKQQKPQQGQQAPRSQGQGGTAQGRGSAPQQDPGHSKER